MWSPARPIPWDSRDAPTAIHAAAREFLAAADGRQWQIAWCAGAGVTGTTAADLAAEAEVFRRFLDALAASPSEGSRGGLFLASSAGGVYAGSTGAPFSEGTVAVPISPYGHAKLDLESLARDYARSSGSRLLIGRIANLYGPGQNLAKPQGLISQICRAHLLRQPISIYVPLDTVRDYIFAPDCGGLISDGLLRLSGEPPGTVCTKVLASQQGVTIGFLVAELRRIFKRAPKIVFGASASSRFQVRDLRLRSTVWPELDRRALTPLPAGIIRTVHEILGSLQAATLK